VTVGVYDKLQTAVPAVVPAARVHAAEVGTNFPVELVEKLTVPVGVVAPNDDVSVTVTRQVLNCPAVTGFGVHDTIAIVVSRGAFSALTGNVAALVLWLASPL
jgi:hypothetical protein